MTPDQCPYCRAVGGNPWRKPMETTEFRITPKGILAVALMEIGVSDPDQVEQVWRVLADACDVTLKTQVE